MKIPALESLISSKYFGINKVDNKTQKDTLTYANRAQIAYALIKDAIYEKENPKENRAVSEREAEAQVNQIVDTLLQDYKRSVEVTERPTMGDAPDIQPSYFASMDTNPYGEIMTEEMQKNYLNNGKDNKNPTASASPYFNQDFLFNNQGQSDINSFNNFNYKNTDDNANN